MTRPAALGGQRKSMITDEQVATAAFEHYYKNWRRARSQSERYAAMAGEDTPSPSPRSVEYSIWGFRLWWERNAFDYSYLNANFESSLRSFLASQTIDRGFGGYTIQRERLFVLEVRNRLRRDLGYQLLDFDAVDEASYRKEPFELSAIRLPGDKTHAGFADGSAWEIPSDEEVLELKNLVCRKAPERWKILQRFFDYYFCQAPPPMDDPWFFFIFLEFFGDLAVELYPGRSLRFYQPLIDFVRILAAPEKILVEAKRNFEGYYAWLAM